MCVYICVCECVFLSMCMCMCMCVCVCVHKYASMCDMSMAYTSVWLECADAGE